MVIYTRPVIANAKATIHIGTKKIPIATVESMNRVANVLTGIFQLFGPFQQATLNP